MSEVKKIATRDSYGNALASLGREHENLVVLDADLAAATKTGMFKKVFPERHIDCGIAESNMAGVAAGLSLTGKIPFMSSFAMFAAGRAFEQVRNSIAYPKINVKIGATHGGISVGEDGATHQCCEDFALMRVIPGMVVACPSDDIEAKAAVKAALDHEGPVYIRFGRLAVPVINDRPDYKFELGKGVVLQKGEKVAFVGASGSGKSTLIKILLGLLKYNKGHIRLGEMELSDICLNDLYDKVSYISQDAPVFDGTIQENLVFEKKVSKEQMLKALSEVQLSYLAGNLKEGFNTEIGEKGTCLSGGEKQRLALARLWFQDAELVVLDEATSAMDNLTEENVMKAVMHKLQEKTVIAIAHRLSSIADFDRIILFRDGQIVGQGSFEELMRTNAYFMELYHASMQS